jgi:N6-L-threonylcarbamoyladenine synthase
MLNLGYPGGPILAELAREGEVVYPLPEPMVSRKDMDFSFSGLKTACNYYLKEYKPALTRQFCCDFAASFEDAVLRMIERRLKRAIELYQPTMLFLGGGVVANVTLRGRVRKVAQKHGVKTVIPYSKKLYTDNAAMIGVVGYFMGQEDEVWEEVEALDRSPNLRLESD